MPETNRTDSVFGHHGDLSGNEEFSRRQSLYRSWPVDERLTVWIEIVRQTDKTEYVGDDHRFMLHIFSTLKHTLPDYDWTAADKKLENEVIWHLEHFNMPAWDRIMRKLVHGEKYDSLQVAMEHLRAYKVQSPRLPGIQSVRFPLALKDFKFQPETHHITMEGMVVILVDIINEARKWKNAARGYISDEEPLQRKAEKAHVLKLYKQDLEDLKTRAGLNMGAGLKMGTGLKMDDQRNFLESIHKSIGI